MGTEALRIQIEVLRKELIDLAQRMGLTAVEVVEKSQKLDNVLNEYTRQHQRKNKARLFRKTNEPGRRFGPLRPLIIPHTGELNTRGD